MVDSEIGKTKRKNILDIAVTEDNDNIFSLLLFSLHHYRPTLVWCNRFLKTGPHSSLFLSAGENESNRTSEILINIIRELPLIEQYDLLRARNNFKNTALHFAALNGQASIFKFIIDTVKKIKLQRKTIFLQEDPFKFTCSKNSNRSNILHFASYKGHIEIVKLILEIVEALSSSKVKILKFLCAKDKLENTALHYASNNGHTEIVKMLLKKA